jgi:hypothetical protein
LLTDDAYSKAVLDNAIGDPSTPAAAVGVVDGLYEINESSPLKVDILVGLLDYYLGSAGSAVLNELITKNGDRMLPALRSRIGMPVECLEPYRRICITDVVQRDSEIKMLIQSIESGVVLCVDENDC